MKCKWMVYLSVLLAAPCMGQKMEFQLHEIGEFRERMDGFHRGGRMV